MNVRPLTRERAYGVAATRARIARPRRHEIDTFHTTYINYLATCYKALTLLGVAVRSRDSGPDSPVSALSLTAILDAKASRFISEHEAQHLLKLALLAPTVRVDALRVRIQLAARNPDAHLHAERKLAG